MYTLVMVEDEEMERGAFAWKNIRMLCGSNFRKKQALEESKNLEKV